MNTSAVNRPWQGNRIIQQAVGQLVDGCLARSAEPRKLLVRLGKHFGYVGRTRKVRQPFARSQMSDSLSPTYAQSVATVQFHTSRHA